MNRKKIGAVIVGGTVLAAGALTGMAANTNADQAARVGEKTISRFMHKDMKKGKGMHIDKKKIDEAIIAGDYNSFKSLASTTPLANISEAVFKSLQAPTIAEKQARDSIQTILTNAGITMGRGSSSMMNR